MGRTGEGRRFEEYGEALLRLAELPAAHRAELDAAQRTGSEEIADELSAERTTKDAAADIEKQLDSARARLRRLAVRAGVTDSSVGHASSPKPGRIAEFAAPLRALTSDVASAESAWAWVERTRGSVSRQAAPVPAPVVPMPATDGSSSGSGSTSPARWMTMVAISLFVILVALVALIVLT